MASAVKPHFGTADTEPENFHHRPETSIYHFIFNRRPSLLFHKRKWKPRRGSPGPSAPSPADAAAYALLTLLLQRRPRPIKVAPISLLSCAQKPSNSLHVAPPCVLPGSYSTVWTGSYLKAKWNQSRVVSTCLLYSSHALSSPHRRYFEVVPLRIPTC